MNALYCFDVDANGEDFLLLALKAGLRREFDMALQDGHDPFVPSPFGQCCGGLSGFAFRGFETFDPADWAFNQSQTIKTAVYPTPQFMRHAARGRLAYTLPYLTGIHRAAATGNCAEIERLREHVNDRDAFGYLPVIYAVGCCRPEAVNVLNRLGGQSDTKQGSSLLDPQEVVAGGRFSLPLPLINTWSMLKVCKPENCQARHSLTIHQAAAKGDLTAVRNLLRLGVPVDIKSYNGSTALLCAVKYGQSDACILLRKAGADSNACNYLGETPASVLEQMRTSDAGIPVFSGQSRARDEFSDENKDFVVMTLDLALCTDKDPQWAQWVPEPMDAKLQSRPSEDRKPLKRASETEHRGGPKPAGQAGAGDAGLIQEILDGGTAGDFQRVLHAYCSLPEADRQMIPRDLAEKLLKADATSGTFRVGAWLYLRAGLPNSCIDEYAARHQPLHPEEILREHSPVLFLAWIKARRSISEDDILLDLACRNKDFQAVKWLLAMGASLNNYRHCSGMLGAILGKEIKDRESAVKARPLFLSDDILFAATTGNVEYFLDCFDCGLDLSAKAVCGLDLTELSRFLGLKALGTCIRMLENGRTTDDVRQWLEDEAEEDDDNFIPLGARGQVESAAENPEPSAVTVAERDDGASEEEDLLEEEGGFIPLGEGIEQSSDDNVDEHELEDGESDAGDLTGLEVPEQEDGHRVGPHVSTQEFKDIHGHEVKIIRVSSEKRELLGRVLVDPMPASVEQAVYKALSEIMGPPYIVGVFKKAQHCRNDFELKALVNDDMVTLELFWAMKLYADAKAEALMKSR